MCKYFDSFGAVERVVAIVKIVARKFADNAIRNFNACIYLQQY